MSPAPTNAVAPADVANRDFVLGAGDEISIRVWRNDDLNRMVRVDPAGNIDFPLIGPIHAEGMSLPEFRRELTDRLGEKYLVNPRVDVGMQEIRSRKIFVVGEVKNPGALALDPRATVLEAIAGVGGFTPDANRRKVLLVRVENGVARAKAVDASAVFSGGETPSIFLKHRDLLYIMPSRIASVERFMQKLNTIVAPIIGLESAVILTQDATTVISGSGAGSSVVVPR